MTSTGTTLMHRGRLAATTALTLGLTALGVATATPASAVPPQNDNLASATAITPGNYGPTVTDATLEPGETGQPGCDDIAHSIWEVYTATDNQVAHLFTTGGHDMVVNVWTSTTPNTPTIGSLEPVTCDDETNAPDADVFWQLTTGTRYFIQIANYSTPDENDGGGFTFAKAAGPGNNNLSAATTVALDASATNGTTDFSSLEPGERSDGECAEPYNSTWYSWTAPASTGVDAQTSSAASDRDTVLRVYSGTATFNALDAVGCNDDIDDTHPLSRVGFNAVQGTTYFFQVSDPEYNNIAHAVPGAVAFRITTHPAPPNDALSGATVASVPSTVDADTTYAGTEAGEPQPTGTGCHVLAHSVWYRYQATSSGTLGIETLGAIDVDTNLAIYSGPASGATSAGLTQVGCNDDQNAANLFSKASLPVTAGTTYYVQVGNYVGLGPQAGSFQVHFFSGTTTALDASAAGRTVTLATTVTGLAGPAHGGSVQFFDGARAKGTVPLEEDGSAVLTIAAAASGAHSYKAVFLPGDGGDFTTSESAVKPVTVTDAPPRPGASASSTKLTVPKKVVQGKKVTVAVSVITASGPATGSVLVVLGGKLVTLTLTNGKATLSTKLKTPGSVSVVAVYAGTDSARSSTATAKIKVQKKPRKK